MSWLDWAIVVVVALSLVVGLFRGLVREVIGLAGWIAAGVLATWYAEPLAVQLPAGIAEPVLRWGLAFLVIFLGVLVIAAIVSLVVHRLMSAVGLGFANRLLGGAFGAARGVVILAVAALLVGLTPFREDPVWRESRLVAPLQALAEVAMPWIPESVRERLGPAVVMQDPRGAAARSTVVSGASSDRVVRRAP